MLLFAMVQFAGDGIVLSSLALLVLQRLGETITLGDARAGIDLKFVIYPVHAHTLVLFHLAGLWPGFEAWKRELVDRIEHAPSNSNVSLWDFSGFSPYSIEDVPPPGDIKSEMRWYWEGGHFKRSLGDVLLENVLNSTVIHPQFGHHLSVQNLDDHLQSLRTDRDKYELVRSMEVEALRAMVDAAISPTPRTLAPE